MKPHSSSFETRPTGPREARPDDKLRRRSQDEERGRKVLPMFEKGLLRGKRILVTGGGTGLGAAMGPRFVELGADLVICGRRLELLEATAAPKRGDPGRTGAGIRRAIR